MNNLVNSAIALSLFAAPSLAADNGWAGLDKEIESLSTTLAQEAPKGPKLGGFFIASYRYSADATATATTPGVDINGDGDFTDTFGVDSDGDGDIDGADVPLTETAPTSTTTDVTESGVQLDQVRLSAEGDLVEGYKFKISFDLHSGAAEIKDAYITWAFNENFELKIGRFRQPFLQSSMVSDDKLLFIDRTVPGDLVGQRDEGLSVKAHFETLTVWVAGQNGLDGMVDDYLLTGRIRASVMGGGAYDTVEGAYGSNNDTNLSVGAAIADEGALDKGVHYGLEAQLVSGPFSVAGEVVDFDTDIGATHPFAGNSVGDTTIWDATASYLITNDYEVALRYEDADDDNNTTRWSGSVLRYINGHNLKWILQYSSVQSDSAPLEVDEFALGISATF